MDYRVKGWYLDNSGRNRPFITTAQNPDKRFLEQLIKAQYPAQRVFINSVSTF